MIDGIGRRHIECLPRIDKETDFKLVAPVVGTVKLEAVEFLVLVAGRLEDHWLVFLGAALFCENIKLHRFSFSLV